MRIRHALSIAALFLMAAGTAFAGADIHDIEINVLLSRDGTANIEEKWDITANSGTEWYLVRENLGDIEISNLKVSDESGRRYIDNGSWDINAPFEAKAGRCGIVRKYDGCEICWGLGSYGHHVYTVQYRMSNVVKSLNDYDMLHMQFVSDQLSSSAEHVKLSIMAPIELSDQNTRIWGFGFKGNSSFEDGCVIAETDGHLGTDNSVIMMLRFDKGFFTSSSVQNRNFQDAFDYAVEGADFGKTLADRLLPVLSFFCFFLLMPILFIVAAIRSEKKKKEAILGMKPKEVSWFREAPADGSIYSSYYVLNRLGELKSSANLSAAVVLRMLYDGLIGANRNAKGDIELDFNKPVDESRLDAETLSFYNFLKDASGSDLVLQKKEFGKWAAAHVSKLTSWTGNCNLAGAARMKENGMIEGRKFTAKGQEHARQALGFKKFLEDFTLIGERSTPEVTLWQDYLVYGALFGIAEKVADELSEINPDMFKEINSFGTATTITPFDTIRMVNNLGSNIRAAELAQQRAAYHSNTRSFQGFGGRTSIGGGGGFSGGGHGGGLR